MVPVKDAADVRKGEAREVSHEVDCHVAGTRYILSSLRALNVLRVDGEIFSRFLYYDVRRGDEGAVAGYVLHGFLYGFYVYLLAYDGFIGGNSLYYALESSHAV